MLLDKKTYDECTVLLKEKNYKDLERRMDRLNEDLIVNYVQDYLKGNGDRIKDDLRNSNRYKIKLASAVTDWLSYRIGAFDTVILVFELLVYKKNKKEDFLKRIKALNAKRNINKILLFLFRNPDAQHKAIAESTGLKVNYLSELMRELENAECVDRYAIGKRSFYSLSSAAREFVIEENSKKVNDIYKYRKNEYLKYEFSINSQTSTISSEKYDGIKPYKISI